MARRAPERTCVGCRRVRPKAELVRLVLHQGRIVTDRSGDLPGRGAYVCPVVGCAEKARPRLGRALRLQGEEARAAVVAWAP